MTQLNETFLPDEVENTISEPNYDNLTDEDFKLLCGDAMENDIVLKTLKFYSSGISVCIVGSFGLVGNILTCLTLKSMSRSITLFNKLLLTLAFVDSIFILTGGAFMTKSAFKYNSSFYNAIFPILTYPLAGLSMTGSTYLCVAISLERYLGICHRTIKLHRKFRFYLIAIIILTFTIESPRFFELERTEGGSYKYAKHRWSPSYVTYYCMWFRLFATALVPLISLIYCNAKILIYYRENNFTRAFNVLQKKNQNPSASTNLISERNHVNQCEDSKSIDNITESDKKVETTTKISSQNKTEHRERTLFIMVCCITFTFFICHLPRISINVYDFVRQESVLLCTHYNYAWNLPRWGRIVNEISQALLIVNSSANFVYYCLVGRAFRRHLFQMLKKYCGCTCQWMKFCIENNSTPENSRPTVVTNLEDSDHENEKHVQRELIRLQSVEVCI